MREEMARMRETVMSEADTDKDGLLSEMEFLQLTKRPDFHDNDTWDPLFVSAKALVRGADDAGRARLR